MPAVRALTWHAVVAAAAADGVWAALGVHPEASDDVDGLEAALLAANAVAVGEIGLDRRLPQLEAQLRRFRAQLALAERLGLPVLVHCVRAHDLLGDELRRLRPTVPVVLHAFSGSRDLVAMYAALGCYFSFSGTVSWGGRRIPNACAAVPADRLLVETDAPFLSPAAHRGKPCEPRWIVEVVRAVADIRGASFAATAELTTANAERVFCVERRG